MVIIKSNFESLYQNYTNIYNCDTVQKYYYSNNHLIRIISERCTQKKKV